MSNIPSDSSLTSGGIFEAVTTTIEARTNECCDGVSNTTIDVYVIPNIFQILYLSIGGFGFVSNLYVIFVIIMYKPMHKQITNIYIANQSALDATVSFILILTHIFKDDGAPHRYTMSLADQTLCKVWYAGTLLWCAIEGSMYSVVALTYDRYFAVVYPIWYKTQLSNNKWMVALSIAFIWLVVPQFNTSYTVPTSGITADGACVANGLYPSVLAAEITGVFVFLYEFLCPSLLIIYGYAAIVYVLQKRVRMASDLQLPIANENNTAVNHVLTIVDVETTGTDMGKSNGKSTDAAGSGSGRGGKTVGRGRRVIAVSAAGSVVKRGRNSGIAGAKKNVIKTASLVGFFFICCWSLSEVSFLMLNFGYTNNPIVAMSATASNDVTAMIGFFNCCINPIIYTVNYRLFKKGVVHVFNCRSLKRRSARVEVLSQTASTSRP